MKNSVVRTCIGSVQSGKVDFTNSDEIMANTECSYVKFNFLTVCLWDFISHQIVALYRLCLYYYE